MPLVRIDMFPGRSLEQKREITDAITRELVRIAKCRPESVMIMFNEVTRENWGRSGTLFVDEYPYD